MELGASAVGAVQLAGLGNLAVRSHLAELDHCYASNTLRACRVPSAHVRRRGLLRVPISSGSRFLPPKMTGKRTEK